MKGSPRIAKAAQFTNAGNLVKQTVAISTTVTVAAVTTAVGFGTAVIAGLPQGNIMFFGAVSYLQLSTADTDLTATFDGDYSIGTVATVDVDVSDAGEADIIASTALGAAADRVSPVVRGVTANTSGILTNNVTIFDNTAGDLELNLNVLIDAANITDDTSAILTAKGVVHLAYLVLGDD